MKSNLKLIGLFGLVLVACLCHVSAQDDDDFDDGIVTEDVEATESDAVDYVSPSIDPSKFYFAEHFDDPEKFKKKWVTSQAKKDGADEQFAKYDGEWQVEKPQRSILKNDLGLVLKSKIKHAAISARLNRVFEFNDKPLIVQYEVTMQEGQECGGAYLKLITAGKESSDLAKFHDKTPYTIMFGPDKCGNDHKLHFIFKHKNPKNASMEEKHCKKPNDRLEEPFKDKRPHLYTLVVKPDNSFHIYLDHKEVNSGSLLEDFTPPVNPPEEIEDPSDKKPDDWDERERIPDPTAVKPDDWDETAPQQIIDPQAVKPDGWLDDVPEMIPDPSAVKPDDWDLDMDGEWEAPLIENPACSSAPGCGKWSPPLIPNPEFKGFWRAPLIPNPQYQGKWSPRKIPNPDFFRDDKPFKMSPISAIGFELWSMSPLLLFDNIVVTDNLETAQSWAQQTFNLKLVKLDQDAVSWWGRVMKALNYRPGWWAVYFIYCSIPVCIYIWYLQKRVKEDSLWTWLVKTTDKNPWLWAVYVLVVALITGFVIFTCCTSSKEKDEIEKEAESKKTDAVTEDQPEGNEEKNDYAGEGEAEEEGDSNDERNSQDDDDDDDEDSQPSSKQDLEAPMSDDKAEVDVSGSGDVPRKRKPRKD